MDLCARITDSFLRIFPLKQILLSPFNRKCAFGAGLSDSINAGINVWKWGKCSCSWLLYFVDCIKSTMLMSTCIEPLTMYRIPQLG